MATTKIISVEQVKGIAKEFGLPYAVVCAVIEQESDWETYAIRYEPGFYSRYVEALELPLTEARARSFSWGLMQIMGQTAREMGYTGHMAQLTEPTTGLRYGCKFLSICLRNADQDWGKALFRWNGGGNPDYAKQVLARVKNYQAGD